MTTWMFSSAASRWMAAALCLACMARAATAAEASAQTANADVTAASTLVAIEWLPLYANSAVIQALQRISAQKAGVAWSVERRNLLADDAKLAEAIAAIGAKPETVVLGFGDHVCRRIAEECQGVKLIALSARDRDALVRHPKAKVTVIDTEPRPEQILRLCREIRPDIKGLAVLYTDAFAPNVLLADTLGKACTQASMACARITVHPGFCRTDSDYRQAIQKAHADASIGVVVVPEDPNSSRFGAAICSAATECGMAVIGTEAIAGKGCAASLETDVEAVALRVFEICSETATGKDQARTVYVERKMVRDSERKAAQGKVANESARQP